MTVLLRSLIIWLMLLALPYQGYAAAAMTLCVAPATTVGMQHADMPSGPHDHAAMMAAMADADADGGHGAHGADSGTGHADSGHAAPAGHDGHSSHSGVKCSGSACCAAGAPVLTPALDVAALQPASAPVPFYSHFLPAVDLAHPERPPQGQAA